MNDQFFDFLNSRRPPARDFYYCDEGVKEYKRLPRVLLPNPRKVSQSISGVIEERRSTREFSAEPLSNEDISTILFWSAGIPRDKNKDTGKRPFPSGGGKYPIELYPVILNCGTVQRGVYHYNAKEHALEFLSWADADNLLGGFAYPFVRNAAMVVFMSLVRGRQIYKYGSFSYKLGLIEAGHVGQNLYLLSAAERLGCCALGVGDSEPIERVVGLDGVNEMVCYAVAVGSVSRDLDNKTP